jgi:hypothetical protein
MKSPLQATIFFHDDTVASSQLAPVPATPLLEAAAPIEEADPYVLFSIQVRRSTYQQLKQAQYWEPGFGEMREHVDAAIVRHLATLPGSMKPLPAQLLGKSKKLKKS